MTKIAVIVGSLRRDSINKTLARNLEKLAPEGVEFDHIDISQFPLFNQDFEADFPAVVSEQKRRVEAADGVLLVTPEYNRSYPGVLKNAIDWMSRPWGNNSFDGKPVGIVGATGSPLATGPAQAALRQVAVYLGMHVMGQPELYLKVTPETFDENSNVTGDSRRHLQGYIDALSAHTSRLGYARETAAEELEAVRA